MIRPDTTNRLIVGVCLAFLGCVLVEVIAPPDTPPAVWILLGALVGLTASVITSLVFQQKTHDS